MFVLKLPSIQIYVYHVYKTLFRDSVHGSGICYSCDECNMAFNTKSELRAHKKESHKKQYMCDQAFIFNLRSKQKYKKYISSYF